MCCSVPYAPPFKELPTDLVAGTFSFTGIAQSTHIE